MYNFTGAVLFELRKVSDDDAGYFTCKVHLKGEPEGVYKHSRKLHNVKCEQGER